MLWKIPPQQLLLVYLLQTLEQWPKTPGREWVLQIASCAKTNLRETPRPAEKKAGFSPEALRHCIIVKNFTSVFLKKLILPRVHVAAVNCLMIRVISPHPQHPLIP